MHRYPGRCRRADFLVRRPSVPLVLCLHRRCAVLRASTERLCHGQCGDAVLHPTRSDKPSGQAIHWETHHHIRDVLDLPYMYAQRPRADLLYALEPDRWYGNAIMAAVVFLKHPPMHEPTEAQKHAGNYPKRNIPWRGLTISIENEQGSMRRGKNRDGGTWEQRMSHPYGYFNKTEGVDGDHVDCFVGPNLSADTVYVVHARKVNRWDQYDEDKVMVGFNSADGAKQAFIDNYTDPRFFGDMVSMPAEEFLTKVRATADKPAMIKAQQLSLFDEPVLVHGA